MLRTNLLEKLRALRESKADLEQYGPNSDQGRSWLAEAISLLAQYDPAQAEEFKRLMQYLALQFSSHTLNSMQQIIDNAIANTELHTCNERDSTTSCGFSIKANNCIGSKVSSDFNKSGLELFYSYSHKDEYYRKKLETHLAMLKREGLIYDWHDRKITAGENFSTAIDEHMETASIVLFLVSADFLASDYCMGIEVNRAIERNKTGEAIVIPVIVRPCDWHSAPFGSLLALPQDGRAVTSWKNRDEALTNVAHEIRKAIEKHLSKRHDEDKFDGYEISRNTISVSFGECSHIQFIQNRQNTSISSKWNNNPVCSAVFITNLSSAIYHINRVTLSCVEMCPDGIPQHTSYNLCGIDGSILHPRKAINTHKESEWKKTYCLYYPDTILLLNIITRLTNVSKDTFRLEIWADEQPDAPLWESSGQELKQLHKMIESQLHLMTDESIT